MTDTVLWERTIDHAKIKRRNDLFLKFYCGPAVAAMVLGLIFAGPWGALGIGIFVGLFGMLLGGWVLAQNHNEQANRVITVSDGHLVLGKRRVNLAEVNRYTTVKTTHTASTADASSTIDVGKAMFRRDVQHRDGRIAPDITEFVWPQMDLAGVATVKAALDTVLPGRWVELQRLHD